MSRPYQIIPLVERTDAWWAWRQGGLGSSDAASILGEPPAKSRERLLRDKRELPNDQRRSFSRAQGVVHERRARLAYTEATGVKVAPACVQSVARPWQRASLDGLSDDGQRAVEIKCGLATYQQVAARQRPPRHHFAQLQHILAVTGLPSVDYWCYVPGRPALRLEVRSDAEYLERLLAAEDAFWRRLAGSRDVDA